MKQYFAIALFILTLVISASALFLTGGFDTESFPEQDVRPFIGPAGYTFLIWAVIYLWLLAATFLQWRRYSNAENWDALRAPLFISLLAGLFWGPSSTMSPFLSFALILIMWGGAVMALFRAPDDDHWVGREPIGLYAGWLTAASGVSLGSILLSGGYVTDPAASLIGFGLIGLLAFVVLSRETRSFSYLVALIWALIGIIVRNTSEGGSTLILGLAAILALGLAALLLRRQH